MKKLKKELSSLQTFLLNRFNTKEFIYFNSKLNTTTKSSTYLQDDRLQTLE